MNAIVKLALTFVLASVSASSASATTYVLTNDGVLNATITTNDANTVVTGITGTFLGSAITGLISNPYGNAPAYFNTTSENITPYLDLPNGTYGYVYDNFVSGGTFNTNGILFRTSTNVVNVFEEGGTLATLTNLNNAFRYTNVPGNTSITSVSAAVPEPTSWALMLVGFGAIGASMRRTRYAMHIAQAA